MCKVFICPYLKGRRIQRPDAFQETLKELKGNLGNYIPSVSSSIPVEEARQLIRATRTIPSFILQNGRWLEIIMPLEKEEDGSWTITEDRQTKWEMLYNKYGETLSDQIKTNVNILMV